MPPPAVTAAPAPAVSTANPSLPALSEKKAGNTGKKKAPAGVLATVNAPRSSPPGYAINDGEPCAGLEDAALDKCIDRYDAGRGNDAGDAGDPSLDRPELTAHDRELIAAEEAAARDRRYSQDNPPEDDPALDDPSAQDDPADIPPDDYPPDENADEPPPDDPYNH